VRHRLIAGSLVLSIALCAQGRARAQGQEAQAQPAIRVEPKPEHDAELQRWLDAKLPQLIATYRALHAQPELSLHEKQTSARVMHELERAGYAVTAGIGGYGVAGVLQNGAGPTVLVRGDMDALPVTEDTGLAFASKVTTKDDTGTLVHVMHACGHDLHTTNLLATAAFLAEHRALWSGTLLIVAQPAEELGEGASRILTAPAFQRLPRPNYAVALHVEPSMPAGTVAAVSGWSAANVDSVDITIYGRGGHGARPQDAIDPIVTASYFVTELQTLVSRRNDPQEPAVITVGSFHGGTKHNVIPDEVKLQLTVRSFSDAVRARLLEGIAQLARDNCASFGCPKPPDVRVKQNYTPAVYNDPSLTAAALRVFTADLGAAAVVTTPPTLGGEDFGRFSRELGIPGLLFRLGATAQAAYRASLQPNAAPLPSLHSSRFAPDAEPALRTGVRALAGLVLALMPPGATQAPSSVP
jgi:amidohydrolase